MAGTNTLNFTDANFEAEVLKSAQPVLVDFWAEWCMPCRALGPIVDELATEYAGKAKIGKVNVDSNRTVSTTYGISAIPTLLLFKGGQQVKKWVGLTNKKDFKSAIDAALAG